ncbi:MAG: hypothetical protein QM736_09635 [Vicinamibacterales bacterium]
MTRARVLGALIAIGALSVGLAGQQRAPLPDLQKVKDNFYIIGGRAPWTARNSRAGTCRCS